MAINMKEKNQKKLPQHLIVSSDIRTWETSNEKLFAGSWCFNGNQDELDAHQANTIQKLFKNNDKYISYKEKIWDDIVGIREEIFTDLCTVLNDYYKSDYSNNFFNILLRHWFDWCFSLIYDRLKLTERIIQNNNIVSFKYICSENFNLASGDSYTHHAEYLDDTWNQFLFAKILEELNIENILIEKIVDNSITKIHFTKEFTKRFSSPIFKLRAFWNKLFLSDNDAFIISTYLSKLNELKLNISINKKPYLWSEERIIIKDKVNKNIRKDICEKFKNLNSNYSIIKSMLIELMPVCYLEGFSNLLLEVKTSVYPKNPKFIFTAVAGVFDEKFKLWMALQSIKDTPIYAIQHGGFYGWQKEPYLQSEENTCNKFITWGWKMRPNDEIGFNIVFPKKNKYKQRKKGSLLIIMPPHEVLNYRFFYHERFWNFDDYTKYNHKIKKFVSNIDNDITPSITIRLYKFRFTDTLDEDHKKNLLLWKSGNNNITIDDGKKHIDKLVKKSKLVIQTYESTGVLNTLSQNIPTILIWEKHLLDGLNTTAQKYFKILIDNNILFTDYEIASKFINKVWYNIDSWWLDDKTQEAIRKFCNQYSKSCDDPISKLKSLLN